MQLAYQGIEGSYHHYLVTQIGNKLGLEEKEYIGYDSFSTIFSTLDNTTHGVIAIENSYAGSIHENIYHLSTGKYQIVGEHYIPIKHSLVGIHDDITMIQETYSHPQALLQCSKFCETNNIDQIQFFDTAAAAKMIKQRGEIKSSAIASEHAAKIYGLQTIKKNIQDQKNNTTRFFVITKKGAQFNAYNKINNVTNHKKATFVFATKHTPASLHTCLAIFAKYRINLTKIESLPDKQDPFSYMFWVECRTNSNSEILDIILEELSFYTKYQYLIGHYCSDEDHAL